MTWNTIATKVTGNLVTAAEWVDIRENMLFLEEVAYTEFTSNVSITGTGDVDIVSSGAISYENAPHLIEFAAVRITAGGANEVRIALFDGATEIGRIGVAPTSSVNNFVFTATRVTPTAASHTYKIVGYNAASQTSTVVAGAGGTDSNMPGYIRISRIPT